MRKEDTLKDLELLSSPELANCLRDYFDVEYFFTSTCRGEALDSYMKGVYDVINLIEKVGD